MECRKGLRGVSICSSANVSLYSCLQLERSGIRVVHVRKARNIRILEDVIIPVGALESQREEGPRDHFLPEMYIILAILSHTFINLRVST